MQAVDWTGSDSTEQLMRATSLQNENYYLKKKRTTLQQRPCIFIWSDVDKGNGWLTVAVLKWQGADFFFCACL